MNVVFVSPHFPPQFHQFCAALKERGVNVLGLGDTPEHALAPEVRHSLHEYYYAPLEDYAQAHRALAYFTWKHGRIDRIDSHTEHWLGLEARLREDFNIPGPKTQEMHERRTKSGMARLFREAGVPYPESHRVRTAEGVRQFAKEQGFPLVFKPDLGVGAASTFRVEDEAELDRVLATPLEGYLVQPFVTGTNVSYDGLVDADGRVLFETAHVYSDGVMNIVNQQLDAWYYNRREINDDLRDLGRRTLSAFGIRERFFHVEFFEQPDGSYRALEINIRPPGGFTTDMMNFSADIDVYRLWARMLTGDALTGLQYERRYHVGYVSRRDRFRYVLTADEVRQRVGPRLLLHRPVPRAFSGAMGDELFLIRDADEARLQEDIGVIQQRA